jgi:hypothetical protein
MLGQRSPVWGRRDARPATAVRHVRPADSKSIFFKTRARVSIEPSTFSPASGSAIADVLAAEPRCWSPHYWRQCNIHEWACFTGHCLWRCVGSQEGFRLGPTALVGCRVSTVCGRWSWSGGAMCPGVDQRLRLPPNGGHRDSGMNGPAGRMSPCPEPAGLSRPNTRLRLLIG